MTSPREALRLRSFGSMIADFTRLHLLQVGLELGIFEALRQPVREAPLAERLGLAPELLGAWLRAACAHGLVRRDHHPSDSYRIGGLARWLLDSPQSRTLRAMLEQAIETYGPAYRRLPEVARGGPKAQFGSRDEARRAAEVSRMVEERALSALSRVPGASQARRVLDIGCGYGTYLTGLLVRYRDAHGVGVELDPEVAEEARRRLHEAGVQRRAEVRVGDFMTLEIDRGSFDLVLLSNNLYYFPPDQHVALFGRALRRLAPGGVLAIQVPVATTEWLPRLAGVAKAMTAFDLFLRSCDNLYGLPDMEPLRASLREAGFDRLGEVAILPGGASRYVWARRQA